MGDENQGKCWDHRTNTPGTCAGRFCKRGWTCSCNGRTHLCDLEQRQAIVIDAADKDKEVAPCPIDPATGLPGTAAVQVASGPEISLGSLQFDISPLGAAADDCNQGKFCDFVFGDQWNTRYGDYFFRLRVLTSLYNVILFLSFVVAWWHNGVFINQWKPVGTANIDVTQELEIRENHMLLEARGGDVFAWRYRDGSYYCQIHNIRLDINSTIIEDVFTNPLIRLTYAREFSEDWFAPSFEPVYGTSEEQSTDLKHFLPPRTAKFNGDAIVPNENNDYWTTNNQDDADSKKSNWYWRLEVDPSCKFTAAFIRIASASFGSNSALSNHLHSSPFFIHRHNHASKLRKLCPKSLVY